MNQNEVFADALWVGAKEKDICPVIRTSFDVSGRIKRATLRILGLGTYVFYVNGKKATTDLFQPINSNYEHRDFPKGEIMAVRSYVNAYDVTQLLVTGKNTVATMLGNGWYDGTRQEKPFGDKKLCLSVEVETDGGAYTFGSSLNDKYADTFVKKSNILEYEIHDYTEWDESILYPEYDDSGLPNVIAAEPLNTEYYYSDCPRDTVIEEYTPRIVKKTEDATVYDTGINMSGIPVLRSLGEAGKIRVCFSEELTEDGEPEEKHSMWQSFEATVGDKPTIIQNVFSWYGFRYFKVEGKAEAVSVLRTHTDVAVTSSFESSDATLNWIYDTYLNTQRCNMHHGIPGIRSSGCWMYRWRRVALIPSVKNLSTRCFIVAG